MQFSRQLFYILGVSSIVCLVGCSSIDDAYAHSGYTIPEGWIGKNDQRPSLGDSTWIDYLSENEPLQALIKKGLESNYNLSIAQSRMRLAGAELKAIKPNRLPSINGQLQGIRAKSISPLPVVNTEPEISNDYSLSFALNWELDLWGKLHNEKQSRFFNYQAAKADFKFAQISLASQIAKLWLNIMHAKGQVQLSEQILEAYTHIEQSMKERYISGLVSAEDYLNVQSSKEALQEEQLTLKKQSEVLTRSLEILLGDYPSGQSITYTPLPDFKTHIPSNLPSDLMLNRPDIVSAEKRIQSAKALVKSAQKQRFPRIQLTGTYGNASDALKNLLDSDLTLWSVGTGITQPLINHGTIKAGIEQTKARFSEAEAYYNQTVLNAFSEVENALSNESYLSRERHSNDQQLKQAREIARINKESYINGHGDFLTLMNAFINVLNAERMHLQIKRSQLENRIQIYHALGESFVES